MTAPGDGRERATHAPRCLARRSVPSAVIAATFLLGSPGMAQAETLTAERIAAIDGDSVAIDGAEWRLQGFDTPEIARAGCEGERRLGILARARLTAMLAEAFAANVEVEIVPTGERDRHRRPLGVLVIGGADAGALLIAEGYARPYNGGRKKGWCSRDSRDDLVPGPAPARALPKSS